MSHPIGLFHLSAEAGRIAIAPPWLIAVGLILFAGILVIASRTGGEGG